MKNLKKITCALTAAALSLSLAACGEASIAESALRMSQQVRAALGEPQRGIGPWS